MIPPRPGAGRDRPRPGRDPPPGGRAAAVRFRAVGPRRRLLPGALVLLLAGALGCTGTGPDAVLDAGRPASVAPSGAVAEVAGASPDASGSTLDTAPAAPAAPLATISEPPEPPIGPGGGTDGALGSGRPVTIAFAGDVGFEAEMAERLAADPATALGPMAEVLSSADLAVVNLETAITERGTPAPKAFTFRAPPSALAALAAAGVDVASMANNHGVDFGPVGLQDSLAAERATGFPLVGIGADEGEAYAPFLADVGGQRVAVIAATQVLDSSLVEAWTATETQAGLASAKRVDRLVAEVRAVRARVDTVVAYLHWGIELETCPSDVQRTLARQLVDAGADVVVGGHAHRLQGGGRLGTALVHYGLGNFAFYAGSREGARSGVLVVTVTGRRIDGYRWVPAEIRGRVPYPLAGAAAAASLDRWESQRACTGLAP